jgi:hypothetical protein
MSIEALRYVKKLKVSPSREEVTVREKAILWYLADSHREEEKAAWPSISTIANANNLEERTVREILRSLVLKRVVWRDERLRANGSRTSNYWRFTEIDGDPPVRALLDEEKRQILGRKGAAKANEARRRKTFASGNPQSVCEPGCGITHEADAEIRRVGCGNPQGDTAEIRSGQCTNPQGGDAEKRSGGVRNSAVPDLAFDLAVDSAVDLAVEPARDHSVEAPSAAAVQNDKPPQIQTEYKTVWRAVLDSLLWVVGEAVYLRLCVNTQVVRAQKIAGVVEIDVTVIDAAYESLLVKQQATINKTLSKMGFDRDSIRISFVGPSVPPEVA